MALYRIVKNYENSEGWKEGDIVDIAADATALVEQGLVVPAVVVDESQIEVKPVEPELVPDISWKKPDLVTYARALGVKSSGTKQQILDAIKGGD